MNLSQGKKSEPLVTLQLREAQALVQQGRYDEALGTVQEARTADPRNIYVIAFQKQVEQLRSLKTSGAPVEGTRREILQSLPAIIDRATEGALTIRATTVNPPRLKLSSPPPAPDKEAALEKLKDQYFDRADEYVQKGDYEHALAEVRRVYIIHPSNLTARKYEERILQLMSAREDATAEEVYIPVEPVPAPALPIPATPTVHRDVLPDPVPLVAVPSPFVESLTDDLPSTRRRRPMLIVAVLLLLLAGGTIAYLMFLFRSNEGSAATASPNMPAQNTEQPQQTHEDAVQSVLPEEKTPAIQLPAGKSSRQAENEAARPPRQEAKGSVEPKTQISQKSDRGAGNPIALRDDAPTPSKSSPPSESVTKGSIADDAADKDRETSKPAATPALRVEGITPSFTASQKPAAEDFIPVEEQPRIIRLVKPRFPELAGRLGTDGRVKVKVQIGPDGRPLQARIVESSNEVFDAPAIEAVMNSEFSPGRMATGPVTTWITIPFSFSRQE